MFMQAVYETWFSLKWDNSVILRPVATFYKSNSSSQKYNFDYIFGGLSRDGTSQDCWIQRKEMKMIFLNENQAHSKKWEYENVSF